MIPLLQFNQTLCYLPLCSRLAGAEPLFLSPSAASLFSSSSCLQGGCHCQRVISQACVDPVHDVLIHGLWFTTVGPGCLLVRHDHGGFVPHRDGAGLPESHQHVFCFVRIPSTTGLVDQKASQDFFRGETLAYWEDSGELSYGHTLNQHKYTAA